MSAVRSALQVAIALACSGALAAASRVPWDATPEPGAMLRLSWRHIAPTTESCRPPRPDEVAGVPPHMRPTEVCEGGPVAYHLVLTMDGDTVMDRLVSRAGERAVSVLHDLPVAPGRHRVRLTFAPEAERADLPEASFALDRELTFERQQVTLITLRAGVLSVLQGGR